MIENIQFTNINGQTIYFNESNLTKLPTNNMTMEVDARFTERAKSEQHGIYPAYTYWGKRLIHIEGDILCQSAAEYIQQRLALISVLMPRPQVGERKAGDLAILYTGMGETLNCEATLDGYPELPMTALSPSRTPYQINFKTFDPRLYGTDNTVTLPFGITDNIGGRTYNKTYDKSWTGTIGLNSAFVNNGGNFDTAPIVTFFGPVVSPRLTLQRSDGKVFSYKLTGLTLSDVSDYVVCDFAARTVTRWNGTNLYNFAVGSDWYTLEPLPITNFVLYSGDSGSAPSYATVQWRNAYMI